MNLHMARVAIGLRVRVEARLVEQHSVASPYVLGQELARQVIAHVQKTRLGYFPALDYFQEHADAVESDLLDATRSTGWLVSGLVREEITRRLRAIFSSLRFQTVQVTAFTLPTVRPGAANALHELAQHYTPDRVRINLIATSVMRKALPEAQLIERVDHQLHRWLEPHFASLDVNSIHPV